MTYSSEVLADAPQAWWRHGEASGLTMTDSSGNGRSGTYNGWTLAQPSLLPADTDTSATVNGQSTVAHAAWMDQASVTVEIWLKPNASTAGKSVLARSNVWTLTVDATMHPVFTTYRGSNGSLAVTAPTAMTAGQVYHLVGTYDGTWTRLYVNGVEAASSNAKTGALPTTNVGDLLLGASVFGSGGADESAFYSTALSATRVQAHYTAGTSTAGPTGLAAALAASSNLSASLQVTELLAASLGATGGLTANLTATAVEQLAAALATSTGMTAALSTPVDTDTTYSNDGYNYDGTGEVTYDPPVAPDPPSVHRVKVRRIHQSLPAPTLVDGRPT